MDYEELEKKRVGRRIATARAKKSMTQTELAWAIGYQQTEISSYERGKRMPSDPTMEALAKVLGVSVQWLKYGDTDSAILKDEPYGRSITYRHIKGSAPLNENANLESLSDEDKVIAQNLIYMLSLDERPHELDRIIGNEEKTFKDTMEQSRTRKTNPETMTVKIMSFLKDLYPSLYQDVSRGHKLITDAVVEAVNNAIDKYPDLADEVAALNLEAGNTPEEQDANRSKLVDYIFPMIRTRIVAEKRAARMAVKKARGKNVV